MAFTPTTSSNLQAPHKSHAAENLSTAKPQSLYISKNQVKDQPWVRFPSWNANLVLAAWIIGQTQQKTRANESSSTPSSGQSLSQPCVLGGFGLLTHTSAIYGPQEAAVCAIKGETDPINLHRKNERAPGMTRHPQ